MEPIRRALISVADKTGLVPLARALGEIDCEIISTGGTLQVIRDAGIPVRDISSWTQHDQAFGGRIKTLSFETAAAILFDRERHRQEAEALGIRALDMVVGNFYPFSSADPQVEMIDIGGPTMLRAAAKNYRYVAAICDPADYPDLIQELKSGGLGLERRRRLMQKVFHATAAYDAEIAMGMDPCGALHLSFTQPQALRYGENSHQSAHLWRQNGVGQSLCDMRVLGGKPLSYNNLLDVQSGIEVVGALERAGAAVIKHNIPCGLAEAESLDRAMVLAWESDPVSAFGSVVACNQQVGEAVADFLASRFVEVVVAPDFSSQAVIQLSKKKNLRIIVYDPARANLHREFRFLQGALLVQDRDLQLFEELKDATERVMDRTRKGLVAFGLKAARHIRSNAIVIVRSLYEGAYQVLGVGAGQPNRLAAVKLALAQALENTQGDLSEAVLVSDAFFPFADSIHQCADAGIRTIVQPGGSVRDDTVVAACNAHGIAMLTTGIRHFKH